MPSPPVAAEPEVASRPRPEQTRLVMGVWHRFRLWHPPVWLVERIRQRWPAMQVILANDREAVEREIAEADIFVGVALAPAWVERARRLKWVHSLAAGVGHLLEGPLRDRPEIALTCARGVSAITVAEHTVALMLALARCLPQAWRYQQQRHWAQQELWEAAVRPGELYGRTVVLIGLGAIGQQIARRVRAFGMRVLAVTQSGHARPGAADRVFPPDRLDELLPEADFLVLAAPETPSTRHLVTRERLTRLPAGSFLINIARGSLVDEQALAEALRERKIAGAALDVTLREPLPTDSPLWGLDNLLLTPHTAAVTERLWSRQAELLLENLRRWFAGEPLLNRVDHQRGY
jgi:phosphoglycerate dehydrogenase-like enzyme